MHSITIREGARKLRLQGRSYNEISRELNVSKSTLHGWLSGLQLPKKAQDRLQQRRYEGSMKGLLKRNKLQTHRARQRALANRRKGKNMINRLTQNDLLIIGTALYWGEGYKKALVNKKGRKLTHHPVSLSNADPELVCLFIKFLCICCGVKNKDIEINLHLYDHINEQDALRFWQKATNLTQQNFSRVYYGVSISSQHRKKYSRLPYGTAQVRVNSTNLYHQIMGLIEGISNC